MSKRTRNRSNLRRQERAEQVAQSIDPSDPVREVTLTIKMRTNMCPGCFCCMSEALMTMIQNGYQSASSDAIEQSGSICDIVVTSVGIAELEEHIHNPKKEEMFTGFEIHVANLGNGRVLVLEDSAEQELIERRSMSDLGDQLDGIEGL